MTIHIPRDCDRHCGDGGTGRIRVRCRLDAQGVPFEVSLIADQVPSDDADAALNAWLDTMTRILSDALAKTIDWLDDTSREDRRG